ncbi:MAG: hypothetical protein OXG39_00795 [Chloroflexi bacterium]|nr:hypothetical protein [Chloroflexota bacterium]
MIWASQGSPLRPTVILALRDFVGPTERTERENLIKNAGLFVVAIGFGAKSEVGFSFFGGDLEELCPVKYINHVSTRPGCKENLVRFLWLYPNTQQVMTAAYRYRGT